MMLHPPLISFEAITLEEMNHCLIAWGHKIGPWKRPLSRGWFHGLRHDGELVAVLAAGDLMRERCGGFTRREAFELGRVCAARPGLNRVALRLWREFVFPALCQVHGRQWVISYQDAVLHTGNLYRFDGWVQLGRSHSGPDRRSGRPGRSKVIWGWHADAAIRQTLIVTRKSEQKCFDPKAIRP